MKIVFITSGTIKSSISYRCLALAKSLVKKEHDVSIIAPRFDKYSKFKDEQITEIEGVKIIRPLQIKAVSFELGLIPYIFSALYQLHKINPDIIHIYKATPITAIGLLLKFTRKKTVIFDTDDLDSLVMKIEKNSSFKIKLVEWSEKILIKHASAIITGSQYLQKLYSSKNKIVQHIPNGAEFNKIHKITSKKILTNRIIFIGNINRINILKPLFLAMKSLNKKNINYSTTIIGDGTYLKYFKNLSEKFNLKNVKFLGRIPQNELYKYVYIGDIGYSYMPNERVQKACSNMKTFQYMQFGAIPLVSNVGDLPIYTFNGKAGYITKQSSQRTLTATLTHALNNKNENIKKLQFAQKYASKQFAWDILATEVESVYKKFKKN